MKNQPRLRKNFLFVRNTLLVIILIAFAFGSFLTGNWQNLWYFGAIFAYEIIFRFVCWIRANTLSDMVNPYFDDDKPL